MPNRARVEPNRQSSQHFRKTKRAIQSDGQAHRVGVRRIGLRCRSDVGDYSHWQRRRRVEIRNGGGLLAGQRGAKLQLAKVEFARFACDPPREDVGHEQPGGQPRRRCGKLLACRENTLTRILHHRLCTPCKLTSGGGLRVVQHMAHVVAEEGPRQCRRLHRLGAVGLGPRIRFHSLCARRLQLATFAQAHAFGEREFLEDVVCLHLHAGDRPGQHTGILRLELFRRKLCGKDGRLLEFVRGSLQCHIGTFAHKMRRIGLRSAHEALRHRAHAILGILRGDILQRRILNDAGVLARLVGEVLDRGALCIALRVCHECLQHARVLRGCGAHPPRAREVWVDRRSVATLLGRELCLGVAELLLRVCLKSAHFLVRGRFAA